MANISNPKFFLRLTSIILSYSLVNLVEGQDTGGIRFENNESWSGIIKSAKATNKYIFVDCFTTWCLPCKSMDAKVFIDPKVGSFFNTNFINVRLQFDSTNNDNIETRRRYADVLVFQRKFNIETYPTYLFFDPEGKLVHKDAGSCDPAEFIKKGSDALDTNQQYYTQLTKYNAGNNDISFLKKLVFLAIKAWDDETATKIVKKYILLSDQSEDSNYLKFIFETCRNTSDTGFSIILNKLNKFETVIGKNELYSTLQSIIVRSELSRNTDMIDWDKKHWELYVTSSLKDKPLFYRNALLDIQAIVFHTKKDWLGLTNAIEKYLKGNALAPMRLNEFAWTIFKSSSNRKILLKALHWSRMSFEKEEHKNPGYIDTYANLLYKLGKKREALGWELKAQKFAIAQGEATDWGQEIIDKMNRGEKTW
jgi:thioredoxin-related protein